MRCSRSGRDINDRFKRWLCSVCGVCVVLTVLLPLCNNTTSSHHMINSLHTLHTIGMTIHSIHPINPIDLLRNSLLGLPQILDNLVGVLSTTLDSTVDPATPTVRPVSTGKVDAPMGPLEDLQVLGRGVGRREIPGAVGELVLVPVVGDLCEKGAG